MIGLANLHTIDIDFDVTYEWCWWMIHWLEIWNFRRPVSSITVSCESRLRHRTTETDIKFHIRILKIFQGRERERKELFNWTDKTYRSRPRSLE